ncbi:hypothetical protein J4211_02255 [Candidatus Woesearchaeota archaeon]|nr:hypothetical protein [Candidatus Woesearchaeota archaeon]
MDKIAIPYYGAGSGNLQAILYWLNNWGLNDLWIPFILLFSIIFAVLQKIKIFGIDVPAQAATANTPAIPPYRKGDKKINGILAFTISLILAAGHTLRYYPPETDPFIIITTFIPQTGVALVAILLAILLFGFIGLGSPAGVKNNGVVMIFIAIAVVAVLASIIGGIYPAFAPDWLRFNPMLQAVIVVIAVMGLVIWYITRDDTPGPGARQTVRDWFGNP